MQPGYVVAMFNTHLDYVRYGPRLLLNGKSVPEVLASEDEVRTRSIEVLTPDVGTLLGEGYPVFLTGDLNQPSSLDYTEETIGLREGVDEVVPWTVSEALLGVGMRDSFREIHADPVEDPGHTHDNPDFQAVVAATASTTCTPAALPSPRPASSSARSADRTWTASTTRGPPTTARCCRRST